MNNCTIADLKAEYNVSMFFGLNDDGTTDFDDDREQSDPDYDQIHGDAYDCENCGDNFATLAEALKHLEVTK